MRDACLRSAKSPRVWLAGLAVAALSGALTFGNLPIQAANEAKVPAAEKHHAQMLSESFRNAAAEVLPAVVAIQHEMPVAKRAPRSRVAPDEESNPFGE